MLGTLDWGAISTGVVGISALTAAALAAVWRLGRSDAKLDNVATRVERSDVKLDTLATRVDAIEAKVDRVIRATNGGGS